MICIGRSTENQVILYSAVVSRRHVELRRVGSEWEVVNLGTNGTYLNGKRITQSTIVDGAIIRLARSGPNIQVRMGEAAFKELSETIPAARITQSRQTPPIQTEITGGHGALLEEKLVDPKEMILQAVNPEAPDNKTVNPFA